MPVIRLLFVAIVATVAYVLGARAGRGEYKRIVKQAKGLWNSPTVKQGRVAAKASRKATAKTLRGYLV